MASAIRPIRHEDRLSLVEHLTELRTRLIVCVAAFALMLGLSLWQNHRLLNVINKPLKSQTVKREKKGQDPLGQTYLLQVEARDVALQLKRVIGTLPASAQSRLAGAPQSLDRDIAGLSRTPQGSKPVTLGIGEPFTTTLAIAAIFALILSLPVILFQLYAFILPAFSPNERRIALPLMSAVPFLFVLGVLFGYFIVLPAAVRFFQNFNSDQFNVLVQANQYYRFAATVLLAMGLIFQVPVGILAVTRAGILSTAQLRKGRPIAVVACAVVAAFLPGDFITLLLETVPLYVLYEASILIASLIDRREARRRARQDAAGPPTA